MKEEDIEIKTGRFREKEKERDWKRWREFLSEWRLYKAELLEEK